MKDDQLMLKNSFSQENDIAVVIKNLFGTPKSYEQSVVPLILVLCVDSGIL